MQIIPAVDVLDGRVVRLTQGNYDAVTEYAADPVAIARKWATSGARLVHVVDLAGARDGRRDSSLAGHLAEAGIPFQLGGGIRTVADAAAVLAAGAKRVVLGTAAVWDPAILADLVASQGAARVVAAIDVRFDRALGGGWLDEGRELGEVLTGLDDAGVRRVLATGVSRDGMMSGPDTGLLEGIRRRCPRMKIIASGGVGSLSDITELATLGYESVIVGRALYEGRFSFGAAVAAAAATSA